MILCDVTQAYHAASGGIKTYLEAKRDFIKRYTDYEHVLIRPGDEDSVEKDGRLFDVKVRGFAVPGAAEYRLVVALNEISSRLKEFRPNVVELATAYILPGVQRTTRNIGSVLSAFYHTDFPSAYVEPFARRLFGPSLARRFRCLANWYLLRVHKTVDVNFVASALFHSRLSAMGVPRLELLPLGVNTQLFHPRQRDEDLRRLLGASSSDTVFVYAGRIDQEKCIDSLLKAFLSLEDGVAAKLWLIGDGPDRPTLEKHVAGSPAIKLFPYETDRVRLATLLASADAYASAAPHETFGLSVVEAQACGKPVVGVRAGAMIDRVPENTGYLVPQRDVGALANAMRELCGPQAKRMGDAGRRLVVENFSWENTIAKQLELYEHLVHSGRSRKGHE